MNEEDPPIVQRWRAEAEQRGIAIGQERAGREMRAGVRRRLERKFGASILAEADARLTSADLAGLLRWLDLLDEADSWPDLLARLDA